MKTVKALIILLIIGVGAVLAYGWSGLYDVSVGSGHNALTGWYLELVRERSIEVRATDIVVPVDLDSTARIQAGAGHYKDMCAGCHGRPGEAPTEVFEPRPPALYRHAEPPAEAFVIVRNGIKMSAMPQHRDHSDEDIWNIVAFLQRLPELSPEEYDALTANAVHTHADGQAHSHEAPANGAAAPTESAHSHAAPATPAAVVDAFHHALSEGQGEAALALLHAQATILEAGGLETKQEYAAGHLAHDMAFLAQVHSVQVSREETLQDGQAVIVTTSRLTGTVDGKAVDMTVAETAILLQTDGGWRIVQLNWM